MNRKRAVEAAVLILVLVLVGYLMVKLDSTRPAPVKEKISAQIATAETPARVSSQPSAVKASAPGSGLAPTIEKFPAGVARTNSPDPASEVSAPEITSLEPMTVLEIVRGAIRNYGQRFGGNPVGTNQEITRALGGENPGQVNFLQADDGLRVNARGELVDVWGTPFFFHQLSGTEMEIHSAGGDRKMWTPDDLVIR